MDKEFSTDKLSRILRADKHYLREIERRLSHVTGKIGVFDRIVEENEARVREALLTLGVSRTPNAKEVYDALISKIEADDNLIFNSLGGAVCDSQKGCGSILGVIKKAAEVNHGFFLKHEVAARLLKNEPPKKVMEFLGYDSADQMLAKENLLEVYSALRFLEGNEWLNNVFFRQYEDLTPDDFEERKIVVHALSEKWNEVTKKFVMKKWHNISHLKELGVVLVIPISLGISGEILRMISLVAHYLHEVPFYSEIFKKISEVPETFSENLISLLRGDVSERHFDSSEGKVLFLVVQRYLAKDDENDRRLFVPRLNPEALHWLKAEEDLIKLSNLFPQLKNELEFWKNLGWVGDYFKDEIGNDILVSFDLVDTVMSLVKNKELIKYLYHHQEALWNKIFISYFSRDELEKFCKDYLLQGYFEI